MWLLADSANTTGFQGSDYVAQAGLELTTLLAQQPEHIGYVPPHAAELRLHLLSGCPEPWLVLLNSIHILHTKLPQASNVPGSTNSLEEGPGENPIWTLRNSLKVNGE